MTAERIGVPYRRIEMAERTSFSQYISPTKIADLERRIRVGLSSDSLINRAFVDFFRTTLEHGDEPTFDQFLYEHHGALPDGTVQEDWSMCAADRTHLIWSQIRDRNKVAQTIDIILVTHSMLLRNSISRGRALGTRLNDENIPNPPSGMLVIDEGDKMPQVAYDAQSPTTSLRAISGLLSDIQRIYRDAGERTRNAIAAGIKQTEEGLDFFIEWNAGHPTLSPAVVVDKDDYIAAEIIENLVAIDNGLRQLQTVSYGQYHQDDRDILLSDQIERLQETIQAISQFKFYYVPKMSLRPITNLMGDRDLEIMVNLGMGRNLISQYWRPGGNYAALHSMYGVVAISATLTDLPPHTHLYSWFKKHIGYDPHIDAGRLVEKPPIPGSRRVTFGRIVEVIVPDRVDTPHPIIDIADGYMVNPEFVEYGTMAITRFAELQNDDQRMLVLFPSYELIDKFAAKMPHLDRRIIARAQGSNLYKDIKRFADTPGGIFLGVEWEGVNFVDEHRTLVDYLVFAKIPQPPSDHIRMDRIADGMIAFFNMPDEAAKRRAFAISLRDGSALAYRKMVHGAGRGIRKEEDAIQAVLILDDRFPVPRHVAANPQARIIRSGHGGGALFGGFVSIFDPYSVRKWSKMDKTGAITPIYPI